MDHDRHTQKGSKGNPAETFSKERFRGLIEIERAINAILYIWSDMDSVLIYGIFSKIHPVLLVFLSEPIQ